MQGQVKHPSLFEINTRIFLQSLGKGRTLGDIPTQYWRDLRRQGIDWVWLMGIWEIQEKALDPHLIPASMMRDFRTLLPDLTEEDICGSPYAIHDYAVDTDLGTDDDLRALRKTLHRHGMKLMLDFVPNHFGAHTHWLMKRPEFFIEIDDKRFTSDPKTFYQPWHDEHRFFAHGKDPYFDAWQDTVQVNYANPEVHTWLTGILGDLAEICDGVRCDMAMLPVRRIFRQTWGTTVSQAEKMEEFWPSAIQSTKAAHPDFMFLAECYWDMEAELMEMGFDYCYDKVFYDRMRDPEPDRMRQHFHAEHWWLQKTSRFLENHDEHRAADHLGLKKHQATAALVALGPGLRFWHLGQWEGHRKKIPVQLQRAPDEPICGCLMTEPKKRVACSCIRTFYQNLLELAQQPIFREGDWQMIREPASPGLLIWKWSWRSDQVLIAINYSDADCPFSLHDFLHLLHVAHPSDMSSSREVDPQSIHSLAPWCVHVWKVKPV